MEKSEEKRSSGSASIKKQRMIWVDQIYSRYYDKCNHSHVHESF
jgi:hypothetical protein